MSIFDKLKKGAADAVKSAAQNAVSNFTQKRETFTFTASGETIVEAVLRAEKKVTTINFDRNKIRAYASGLSKKADTVSAELDRRTVNTEVFYDAPFDVNDTFWEVLQWHMEQVS